MRLSALQSYILLECLNAKGGRINRQILANYYQKKGKKPSADNIVKIITESMKRLINREFLIGYGMRTPHKWFVREIHLTAKGKKLAFKLQGEQMMLPLKNKRRSKKLLTNL
ncbi:MAG: hypothetical protein ABIJ91_04585 [Candidatus Kuenenbacteria bacterium]